MGTQYKEFMVAQTTLRSYESLGDVYDPDKIRIGNLGYENDGAGPQDNWFGPLPIAVGRPMEAASNIAVGYIHVIDFSPTINYVFAAENSTAAATRRIVMYEHNIIEGTLAWLGFITLTYPATTNHTIRGFRMDRLTYSTGTVAVSGTAVTGSGTTFTQATSGISVGSRIGFGSTDPKQITTWYQVTAIGSATSITLNASAGTINAGTAYVIEEYRAITVTTNATATNGGVYIAKGLNPQVFTVGGTAIPAATTVDGIRAVYWLANAATVTNVTACGAAWDDPVNNLSRDLYVLDSASVRIFKYNCRAVLTSITSGKTVAAFQLVTGNQAVVGTISVNNNGRVAILNHGPGAGVKCLYFVTTTRVYRVPLTNIVDATTTWQTDIMTEVPQGSALSFVVGSGMSAIEHIASIDKLVIMGNATSRSYISQYRTDAGQLDYNIMIETRQQDTAAGDSSSTPFPSITGSFFSVWAEAGLMYMARLGTTSALNQIYVVPFGGHWDFNGVGGTATKIITPRIATPNCRKFKRLNVIAEQFLGSGPLKMPTNPYRVYVRTAGISDNSGAWAPLVDDLLNIGAFGASEEIQVMFEFDTISAAMIPARIFGVGVAYDDISGVTNFTFSSDKTVSAARQFAWRFSTAFGSAVPTLRVSLYNDDTNALIVTDTTDAPTSGTFEKTTDGTTWTAYDNTDRANATTYIRYTPNTLGAGLNVRAVLVME